ncbi:MAG: hypothetical protein ACRDYV_06360 [Acidimicrobiia bacterium]
MKKHIALGIAAAVLGASGVAGAVVSVNQVTSLASSAAGITAHNDVLSANCWLVTGSDSDSGCDTSVAGIPVPGLPELPNLVNGVDIPDATGLLAMATGLVDTATGAVGDPLSLATGLVPTAEGIVGAAGGVPSACGLELPVALPVPSGIFSAGLNLFHMAQNLAMNDLGLAGVGSPLALPVALPVSADDVINKVEDEVGCLSANAGGLPIPAICSVEGGVPASIAANIPAEVKGLVGTVLADLGNITGGAVQVTDSGKLGVSCDIDGALADGLPAVPGLPGLPGLPDLGLPIELPVLTVPAPASLIPAAPLPAVPALPAVPDVAATLGGVVDTVTGVVNGILSGGLPVDALPLPISTPACSASASGSISGLLGSLTSTITGGCK